MGTASTVAPFCWNASRPNSGPLLAPFPIAAVERVQIHRATEHAASQPGAAAARRAAHDLRRGPHLCLGLATWLWSRTPPQPQLRLVVAGHPEAMVPRGG